MNGILAIYPDVNCVLVVFANRDPPAAMEVGRLLVENVILPAREGTSRG
jgi:hypothetical protein